MQLILLILFITITILIAYQDFTSRAVMWVLFPALAMTGLALRYMSNKDVLLIQTVANFLFIIIQLCLLWLVFTLFKKQPVTSLSDKIGAGDILFFFASACFFTTEEYLLYHVLSLVCALIVFGLFTVVRKIKTIPLAGLQAVFLLIVKFVQYGRGNN